MGERPELERLAAGLISEVISAAAAHVLAAARHPAPEAEIPPLACSSSTPLANGRPRPEPHPERRGNWPSPIETANREEEEAAAVPNGCLSAPAWEEPIGGRDGVRAAVEEEQGVSQQEGRAPSPSGLDGLMGGAEARPERAEEATAPPAPGGEEPSLAVACEMKRLNGAGLRNGAPALSEAETDQSGGSDVNSMDSVDSGCTMGAGDSQTSLASAHNSQLIVWEIEVPKHLVGRLIGKQGRYVSFLKQSSGAKIYISTLPYTQDFQICHIEGTQQQVDKALSLIGKKFKDMDLTNLYAPPSLSLPSLPMTSWLLLPTGVTVEVMVVNIVSAGHLFVQQHTHPTYHVLRSLDQQMFLCYSQPGTPALPSPAEVGLICAAPAVEGAWWRAQVISFYKDSNEVEIRYVDYGGYDRVKIDTLRQIRSDFVTLPFQGAEVLLDNLAPLPGEDRFSPEASAVLEEMTRGVALLAQVTNYDNNTGVPLVQMWNLAGEELVSVNRTLAERGLGTWVDSF